MTPEKLSAYLTGLGKPHDELVRQGGLPPGEFIEVYPGALSIYREIMPGLELRFWAEDQRFEALTISLAEKATSSSVYSHELPEPYAKCLSRAMTLSVFGEPIQSQSPYEKPASLGKSGGWDEFDIAGGEYEKLCVIFEYDVLMNVIRLCFSVKETGYDRDRNEFQWSIDS
ncbi:hypothetical protein F3J44_27675 [Pantoea sp. Tr-811]|uniref:DUF6392 family protein n=1 Tax=Pantoea sp. Tr-811 TaxID=2608361 RepID=UPI001421C969|nr:DUF6392 family protein [Pantoea sp. Tr-811]NIF30124.1 hypothetical protein [Pantoea sp. Tr-811]